MLRRLLILAIALLFAMAVAAQCGTISPVEPLRVAPVDIPNVERGGDPLYLVPTIVHIHYGGRQMPLGVLHVQPILDQCNADLRAMNDDLSEVVPEFSGLVGDMGVELRLATRDDQGNCMSGIRYHPYDPEGLPSQTAPYNQNTRRYLNIHILPAINSSGSYPTSVSAPYEVNDGIVLSTNHAANDVRVLAHEVGHWLGLYHVWGSSNSSAVICGDDGIADTPITAGSPTGSCDLGQNFCTPGVVENVQNHMDYSECRLMFTQGQADHALAVLADPALVRATVVASENLLSTGVLDPASCAITAGIHYRIVEQCAGTELQFRAMAEHSLADSVRWTFAGGEPATSTNDQQSVVYASSGNYLVTLTVHGGGSSATATQEVDVDVPDATSNGLMVTDVFPWTEGFEDGFELPDVHVAARPSTTPTWQRYDQSGYASSRSMYVPAEPAAVADTNDVLLGNFDLSELQQATFRLKVSTSNYALSGWSILQLRFIDLCSNTFSGEPWAIWQLNEMAMDNGAGFMPSTDNQWHTLIYTQDGWNLASSGEFVLRLIRPAMPAGFNTEGFWIDDLFIGELPLVTGLEERELAPAIRVAPNPTRDAITVDVRRMQPGSTLRVLDAQGRIVANTPARSGTQRIAQGISPGLYFVQYGADVLQVVLE